MILQRRQFLSLSLLALLPGAVYASVIRKMQGTVKVNGKTIDTSATIKPGDVISTGPRSFIIFVVNGDVYKLGPRGEMTLKGGETVKTLAIAAGSLTAAFAKGEERQLRAQGMTIGIRGTGIYLEADGDKTYFCTCYGKTQLLPRNGEPTDVSTTHHKAYDIHDDGTQVHVHSSDLRNHTDDIFFQLEALVGRRPPESFK